MSSYIINLDNDDTPEILEIVRLAYAELPYAIDFDELKVVQFLSSVQLRLGLVHETGLLQGVLLGLKSYLPTSFAPVATELLWYVKPEYRRGKYALQMVREFEKWAKAQGCVMMTMGNMANGSMETTSKFYERLGYKLSEQTYFKDLKDLN